VLGYQESRLAILLFEHLVDYCPRVNRQRFELDLPPKLVRAGHLHDPMMLACLFPCFHTSYSEDYVTFNLNEPAHPVSECYRSGAGRLSFKTRDLLRTRVTQVTYARSLIKVEGLQNDKYKTSYLTS
jgi:hypothetical protein